MPGGLPLNCSKPGLSWVPEQGELLWPRAQVKKSTTVIPRNSLIEANQSGLIAEPLVDITPQLPIPDYKAGNPFVERAACPPPVTDRECGHCCPGTGVLAGGRRGLRWSLASGERSICYIYCKWEVLWTSSCARCSIVCCRRAHWTWSVKRRARWSAARATSRDSQVGPFFMPRHFNAHPL